MMADDYTVSIAGNHAAHPCVGITYIAVLRRENKAGVGAGEGSRIAGIGEENKN
jgi:hypothetical protein